jgi:hypothetical protein
MLRAGHPVPTDVGGLDGVLRLAERPQHPVRQREQRRRSPTTSG